MKTTIKGIVLVGVLLLGAACSSAQSVVATPEPEVWKTFSDGYFTLEIPDWGEMQEPEPESILAINHNGFFALVNRYQSLPILLAEEYKDFIKNDQNSFLVVDEFQNGSPFLEFTTRSSGKTTRYQAALHYCQGYTYAVVVGGVESVSITSTYQRILSSPRCQDPVTVPDLDTGKIGLMANPAQDDILEGFYPALRTAKENNVQVLHTYLQWGEVERAPEEYFWEWQDYLMGYREAEGFEISLVVNLIHTAVRGPVPADLEEIDFDDPEFIRRFSKFILAFLERYPVNYLSLGNEVNDYFINHRDEIESYQIFFDQVSEVIHQEYPDIMLGMTFAYHDAESQGGLDIIQELNRGDFVPYTLYLYSPGFVFNRDPGELDSYLENMIDIAEGKPIAVVEIGWNTSPNLSGSEEDQAEFVREAINGLQKHAADIEFLSWFSLHDRDLENSYQSALTFIPHRPDLVDDDEFMNTFVDFLNFLGLRKIDGTPKAAWYVFQDETTRYLEEVER
jgi:hypothetical protein